MAMDNDEDVQKALQVLQAHSERRGDSFDIGEDRGEIQVIQHQPHVIDILNNPGQLAEQLNLTPEQAENLRSLVIGGGTGGIHKLLNKQLGDVPASVIGAAISSWIVGKIFK